MTRSIAATSRFLKRRLWFWPLIAAIVLAGLGFWLREAIEESLEAEMAQDLRAVLNSDVEALRLLFRAQEALTTVAAQDPRVRAAARDLVATESRDPADLIRAPKLPEIRAALEPWMRAYEYNGFIVIDTRRQIVAAHRNELIGLPFNPTVGDAAARALAGRATVTRPFASRVVLPDRDGQARAGTPAMYALAPVRDDRGRTIAALALRMAPEETFTRILNIARFGATGDTYAFDAAGRFLSQSRFDDELKRLGLLADQPHVRSILELEVRDPQVDMKAGARPALRRNRQPLTRMAAEAVKGRSGVDVAGYRDFRGVSVVGAWSWLPEYGFGIATEVERAEAYRPLTMIRQALWLVMGLLGVAAAAVFAFSVVTDRMRRKMQFAELEAKQLGRYRLIERIGEGGMGVVYRAEHAMLRRPTAIKLLSPEKTNDASIARFEREVQITSHLNHPNTITVYDYGRTPEGIFYYAMEFLDGMSLQALIDRHGAQPQARVIHIMRQVCGSLAEAHGVGLIHRDVKPANIILNQRGGIGDLVKVLDFGLVKAVDAAHEAALTVSGALTGTPMFMAPEAISDSDRVDARSDLYSLGAVGYVLVTGRPLFAARNLTEVLFKQVHVPVEPPSVHIGASVSADFEAVLLRCLAKNPDDRPPGARELADELASCSAAGSWLDADADAWWATETRRASGAPPASPFPGQPNPASEHDGRYDETRIWVSEG